jgi:hypothetical protein
LQDISGAYVSRVFRGNQDVTGANTQPKMITLLSSAERSLNTDFTLGNLASHAALRRVK